MRIAVTGANGQLGRELVHLSGEYSDFEFHFYSRTAWNITSRNQSEQILNQIKPDFLINTAAYTKVDLAEEEAQRCFEINAEAPKMLAELCKNTDTQLIHISTDYVFNSNNLRAFKEEDLKNPIGVYAQSKSKGEDLIYQLNPRSIILRTSWLYSSYGQNFVRTMIKLGQSHKTLSIVADQIGSPTYARDLASCILQICFQNIHSEKLPASGFFHYCNEGQCSWYEFAKEIFSYLSLDINIKPITTKEYNAKAWRPAYSSLDCTKIKHTFSMQIPHWKDSLHNCLNLLRNTVTQC